MNKQFVNFLYLGAIGVFVLLGIVACSSSHLKTSKQTAAGLLGGTILGATVGFSNMSQSEILAATEGELYIKPYKRYFGRY